MTLERTRPRPPSAPAEERHAISDARDRFVEILSFEHATFPPPLDYRREGDRFILVRASLARRRIGDGRVPERFAPSLFLQAASFAAALQTIGSWASAEDLADALWDVEGGAARLWIGRTPAGVTAGGLPVAASEALGPFLDRIVRDRSTSAAALRAELAGPDAGRRRGDFWVAAAYRLLPADEDGVAPLARLRTVGSAASSLADPAVRALAEKGRALLAGRACRLFVPSAPCWRPGEAIGLPGANLREGVRRLRRELEEGGGRPPLWICSALDRWDSVSRGAVLAAAIEREGVGAEIRELAAPESPRRPDEWRREVLVPCGTVRAALRFSERLAELASRPGEDPFRVRSRALAMIADPGWPAFVADPTGDAPMPAGTPDPDAASSRARRSANGRASRRRPDRRPAAPEEAVASALSGGRVSEALEAARRAMEAEPGSPAERWFELAGRLAAACPPPRPPWLELLQAEREAAGGRPAEAEACLARTMASAAAAPEERRAAALRLAELAVSRGRFHEAREAARAWSSAHPGAPPDEIARALAIEAQGASRSGDPAGALALLDRAEEEASALGPARRLDLALARAAVLSRAGRFEEEQAAYERARALLAEDPDETASARLLAAEALGLADRRDFDAAVLRLEEARAILRDEPVASSRLAIDLAATLYHAGRRERCRVLLEEAVTLAAAAGRRDLVRVARGNLVEAAIAAEEWAEASAGVEALAEGAARDGDATWSLVARHQRGRIALRRGLLDEARRENAAALDLAEAVGDRLEIGELHLERGDIAALEGDEDSARRAWACAAEDPPDRCDTETLARARLAEADALAAGGESAAEVLSSGRERLERGEYAAAEAVARWATLFPAAVPRPLRDSAAVLLRSRGGSALAAIASGTEATAVPAADPASLRALRDAVAEALAGGEPDLRLPFGLAGLVLAGPAGEERVRLGRCGGGEAAARVLRAGSEEWTLRLWPPPADTDTDAAALVLETLLFRPAAPPAPSEFAAGWGRFGVVTADPSMEEPYRRLERFAPRAMTVLVLGESGSGKEAVARAVHALSPRAAGPFVAVNVSAIPGSLVESELFGHVRGAFTGADRDRAGLLEEAARGTVFFDEIGDLAAPLQVKLLRALQDREIRRVGENRPRRIDVRVVSATSRDLAREVESGRFREDLYYRLHVAVIRLPPLRERGRDALLLARRFLEAASREDGRGPFEMAPDAAAAILAHPWPGNVRELQSAVASAAALADGRRITLALLPEGVRRSARPPGGGYRSSVDAHRRDLIMEALDRAGGNRSRAARDLRLSRQALLYLIRELKVPERRAR